MLSALLFCAIFEDKEEILRGRYSLRLNKTILFFSLRYLKYHKGNVVKIKYPDKIPKVTFTPFRIYNTIYRYIIRYDPYRIYARPIEIGVRFNIVDACVCACAHPVISSKGNKQLSFLNSSSKQTNKHIYISLYSVLLSILNFKKHSRTRDSSSFVRVHSRIMSRILQKILNYRSDRIFCFSLPPSLRVTN